MPEPRPAKLLPCPACNRRPMVRHYTYHFYVECGNPKCPDNPYTSWHDTYEDAIRAWNTEQAAAWNTRKGDAT